MQPFDNAELLRSATVTVPEAGKALGLSRDGSYRAARNGYIKVVRIGRKLRVPTALLRRQLGMETMEATADNVSASTILNEAA